MVSSSLLIHGPLVCLTDFLGFCVWAGCKLTTRFYSFSSSLSSTSVFSWLTAYYNTCSKWSDQLLHKCTRHLILLPQRGTKLMAHSPYLNAHGSLSMVTEARTNYFIKNKVNQKGVVSGDAVHYLFLNGRHSPKFASWHSNSQCNRIINRTFLYISLV